MSVSEAGYREIEHTADWELEVWAPDLDTLFEQAARGMYALSGISLLGNPRYTREIEIESNDTESLLVKFLSELLYIAEREGIGFSLLNLKIKDNRLRVKLDGFKIKSIAKEIKAVTFHNLKIRHSEPGFIVNVVFDV